MAIVDKQGEFLMEARPRQGIVQSDRLFAIDAGPLRE
jgi:hypothetical protein